MSNANRTRTPEGVEVRHQKACRTRAGGRCNCTPSYRGYVKTPDRQKRTGPWGPSVKAAENWRADSQKALRERTWIEPTSQTFGDAAREFIDGARDGHVLSRKGKVYKPKTVREYHGSLRLHVLPILEHRKLSEVRRGELQRDLVDALVSQGLDGSTVRNVLDPVRRIFDRALKRDRIVVDPTNGLEVPRATGKRERIADPVEAAALIAALPEGEQAAWATAFYGGLRSAEIRALRVSDLDLDAGAIHVRRGWDDVEGQLQEGKTDAAKRTVAVIDDLRRHLVSHLVLTGRRGEDLVFGRTAQDAFLRSTMRSRARRAWTPPG